MDMEHDMSDNEMCRHYPYTFTKINNETRGKCNQCGKELSVAEMRAAADRDKIIQQKAQHVGRASPLAATQVVVKERLGGMRAKVKRLEGELAAARTELESAELALDSGQPLNLAPEPSDPFQFPDQDVNQGPKNPRRPAGAQPTRASQGHVFQMPAHQPPPEPPPPTQGGDNGKWMEAMMANDGAAPPVAIDPEPVVPDTL